MEKVLPGDPVMLLSVVNTKLRDHYRSFEDLCEDLNVSASEIKSKLEMIDYMYDSSCNQFV